MTRSLLLVLVLSPVMSWAQTPENEAAGTARRVEAQTDSRAGAEAVQETRPAEPGTLSARVRLRMTDGSRLTGELLRVEEGRAIVRTDASPPGPERVISLTEVKSAEMSRGKGPHVGRGAKMGALIGGVALVLSVAAAGGLAGACEGPCIYYFAAGGLAGAAAGAIVGAGIGALRRTDRWAEVPVSSLGAASQPVKADTDLPSTAPDRQMGISIAPTIDRGVQARFSIGWR